jgi:RNA polymerase sigma-70 factor (ECF subfamily)
MLAATAAVTPDGSYGGETSTTSAIVLRFTGDASLAEEVVQGSVLRAWRSIDRFEGRARFSTWLYRIAINEAKRHFARDASHAHEVAADDTRIDTVPDWSQAPERRAEQSDLRAALERAVRALPEESRAPLILRNIEGLSTADAAAVMELGEAAFKSRLHRARLAVREAIQDYLDVEAQG